MMPTIELITKIVVTSINKQGKDYFFAFLTQANEVASQALFAFRADCEPVRDRPCESPQTSVVLLYADFLRQLVFYFLIS
jgi:hypothetical protein